MGFKEIIIRSASYLSGISIEKCPSAFSGEVEVRWVNGRKVLDSRNANYSYGSLHRLFRNVFLISDLVHHPPQSVLIMGMGAGSVIHILRKELELNPKITAIEIDPVVISIARKHFNIDQYKDVDIICNDAGHFITSDESKYDLIVTDLFIDEDVPESFTREPFIGNVLKRLSDNGRVIFNFIARTQEQKDLLAALLEILNHYPVAVSRIKIYSNTVLILKLVIRNS